MSKGIGRILGSYRDVQNLAGYTYLIYELDFVLNDIKKGNYVRSTVETGKETEATSLGPAEMGTYHESGHIKFEDVDIVTPNGDILVKNMNFHIKPGHNCIISGPNGCGKSSLFRILGELWPLYSGKLYRPNISKLFYIPQRPYLPNGTLLDQVIYPHTSLEAGYTNEDIMQLLKEVQLGALLAKDEGLNSKNEWSEVLSGGEKQRMAMARLFYHRPQFAILDECTSTIAIEVEHMLYTKAKSLGITVFTISHRASLFKFHDYYLKFEGDGIWKFEELTEDDQAQLGEGSGNLLRFAGARENQMIDDYNLTHQRDKANSPSKQNDALVTEKKPSTQP